MAQFSLENFGAVANAPPKLGRAAICSTMKDVRTRIQSWVRWHLWVGFERLYIFFDDANETESAELAKAVGGNKVHALMRDSDVLRQAWRRQPSWQGIKDQGKDVDRDVQIRQLCVRHARMAEPLLCHARAVG